eukprot:g29527.t1
MPFLALAPASSAQLEESFEIRVGDGRPPPSWTEESEIKRHLGHFGRSHSSGSDAYGSALGFPSLRQEIARRLSARHLLASEEEILLTFGANHALDLIVRAFLSPGDVVLVDEPGYYPLFAKLKLARVKTLGVRRTAEGPDVDDFISKAAAERPRLFFTQSIGHNPTGSSTSLPVAHALLNAAAIHNITIVEDDPFADLAPNFPGRLAILDQLDRVLSVGTFSKTLSAGLRAGYIIGNRERINALAELKMLTAVNSSGHVERLIHRLLAEGHYDRHLKRLANRIDGAALRVMQKLKQQGYDVFSGNGGGYYLYLLLPRQIGDIELAKRAAKESIFIAPGSVFCLDKENLAASGIRLNAVHTRGGNAAVGYRRCRGEGGSMKEEQLPIVATAAWSIPRPVAELFPREGSGLARYAAVFKGVEINSTFYRRHKPSTFARWADAVPEDFRFSVKIPKEISHDRAMKDIRPALSVFLEDIAPLGERRGPLLCQLPPSLAFDPAVMEEAFGTLRALDAGPVVIEPRHPSWAAREALGLLEEFSIDRVLADPAPVWPLESFRSPSRYVRLHGKPKIYYSSYTAEDIRLFGGSVAADGWCVFDNTASGAGTDTISTWMSYTLPDNFENLTVTGNGRYAFGNSQDNIVSGASGSQTLDGRAGNDVLIGGGGADTFIFDRGNGSDLITDLSSNDTIRLNGYGLSSFDQVLAHATQEGANLRLDLGGGESLVLANTTSGDLQASQFQLVLDRSQLTLSFNDNFNSLSLRDGNEGTWDAKFWWAPERGSSLTENGEQQWYINPDYEGTAAVNPFSVSNGVLTISAEPASQAIQSQIDGYDYTSGLLNTYSSFAQTYGYFEMRADMPTEQGVWPAFWLLPEDGSWPPELDVVEMRGQDPNTVNVTAHSAAGGSHTMTSFPVRVASTEGFHTYGVLWDEDHITWYFDDVAIAQTDTPADMHDPMYMVVNLAVGGTAGAPSNGLANGSEMHVDYIRAYELSEAPIQTAADTTALSTWDL